MIEKREKGVASEEQLTRSEWVAPKVRRLETGEAESSGRNGGDATLS